MANVAIKYPELNRDKSNAAIAYYNPMAAMRVK